MEIDATEVVDCEEWRAGLAGASELVGRALVSMGQSIAEPNNVQGELALAFLKKAVQELEETINMNYRNNEQIRATLQGTTLLEKE